MAKRGKRRKGGRFRAAAFWALALVVGALAVSAAVGRFDEERPSDPRIDDGAVSTRIEVLNGSGQAGAGNRLAGSLREAGFQVVDVRNAERFDYPRTLVVARSRDLDGAREVARFVRDAQLIRQRAAVDWDVTVIVGRDRGGPR